MMTLVQVARVQFAFKRLARLNEKIARLTREINVQAARRPVDASMIDQLMKARRSSIAARKRWHRVLQDTHQEKLQ